SEGGSSEESSEGPAKCAAFVARESVCPIENAAFSETQRVGFRINLQKVFFRSFVAFSAAPSPFFSSAKPKSKPLGFFCKRRRCSIKRALFYFR
ncbi:unnamed protein product, partial [Amoebophrya sp. A120]